MNRLLSAFLLLALSCMPAMAGDAWLGDSEVSPPCMDMAYACVVSACSVTLDVCGASYDRVKCFRCIADARAGALCKHFEELCSCPADGVKL